jgi:hypothetical protein
MVCGEGIAKAQKMVHDYYAEVIEFKDRIIENQSKVISRLEKLIVTLALDEGEEE